jgi:periplasmic protein TonB
MKVLTGLEAVSSRWGDDSGGNNVKFVKLGSRGGNYLVVAENIAWLRSHENGQTKVGVVGGDSLLVDGTIEEVAATILAG